MRWVATLVFVMALSPNQWSAVAGSVGVAAPAGPFHFIPYNILPISLSSSLLYNKKCAFLAGNYIFLLQDFILVT